MADVVDLAAARAERSPHLSGEAQCLECQHRWVAVAPIGTVQLECPACRSARGIWRYPVGLEPPQVRFICNQCDNDIFQVQPDAYFCIRCGFRHEKV